MDTAVWAEFWRVDRRSVQRWLKAGLPVDNPAEMARFILAMKRPADGPRGKAEEILLLERKGAAAPPPAKAKSAEAESLPANTPEPAPRPDPLSEEEIEGAAVDLERASKVTFIRLSRAIDQGDQSSIRFWNGEFIRLQKAIREEQMHARKMGLDEGQLLSKGEVCRLMWALAFWLCRGVEQDVFALAPKLLSLTFEEEVHSVLDRFFMRKRFLGPLTKAVTCPSGVSLPAWLVDTLREAVDDFYEPDGDEEMREFEDFMARFGEAAEAGKEEARAMVVAEVEE